MFRGKHSTSLLHRTGHSNFKEKIKLTCSMIYLIHSTPLHPKKLILHNAYRDHIRLPFSLSLSLSLFYQVLLVFELHVMASSSSSHKQNRKSNAFSELEPAGKKAKVFESSRLFDVFINHRGPDVKETLATELYNSLRQLGIEVFLDSQEKELGKSFPSIIETAIRSAQVHIAIFSPRYAESPWCLTELVLMRESKAKIIPVFYKVKPWELRHIEKGKYAGAFIAYKNNGRYLEKLNEWKEALQTLSFIAGVEFHSFSDYKTIIAAVEKEVLQSKRCLHVAKHPVGLNNLVEDFERRCLDELVQDFENQCGLAEKKNRPNVVGIFGMGGVGKTTLAKELFNRKLSEYSRASFLFDVREESARGELPRLQSKLVKDLFHKEESFTSIEEGTSYLKDNLQRIPLNFLIVVDDIDHVEQLEALLVMDTLSKSGNSLIIVTTRDVGVMISIGITIGYPLKGMDRGNGRQLFCWHAFDQPFPYAEYEALVDRFVDVCGGLPLSLLVLGRLVHGRDPKFWESNLVKAKKTLPRDVKQRLKISFDSLEHEEKQVFVDFACLFSSEFKSTAERILDGSGWDFQNALQTLKDKCLVEETAIWGKIVLRMHDHLRDLGREMALELSPPHRLWRPQDLQSMELMGLQNILAKTNKRCFHSIVDNSMGYRVRFLLGQSDSCLESSASLQWLELERHPVYEDYGETTLPPSLPSLPAWIPLQHLQGLKISGGSFKTLWENHTEIFPHQYQLSTSCKDLQKVARSDDPVQLRELRITSCHELEELPSLSRLNYMEDIEISSCEKLQNITLPTKLVNLSVWHCTNLQRVTGGVDVIKLTNLRIDYCPQLEELPSLFSLNCMEKMEIEYCEMLQKITMPTILTSLSIKNCRDLKGLSANGDLVKLIELTISDCPELEELPTLSRLNYMENIKIESCEKLKNIFLPTILTGLSVRNCKTLQSLSGSGDFLKLTKLIFTNCPELEKFPSLSRVSYMEEIDIQYCEKLKDIILPTSLTTLFVRCCRDLERVIGYDDTKFTVLTISECPDPEELLPIFNRLRFLEKLKIHSCEKLQIITIPSTLISLSIHNCRDLHSILGHGDLIKVKELIISECAELEDLGCTDLIEFTELIMRDSPQLEELPTLSRLRFLETLNIHSCKKIQNMALPTTLINLHVHNCIDLQRVVGSGDLINLTKLFITECPQLKQLPTLCRQNYIAIDFCEKLEKISGIEELPALQWMRLGPCNNALVRNCIHNLKSVPSWGMVMIGRAVDGAESCLNKDMFSEANYTGVDEVIEIVECGISAEFLRCVYAAVIICYVIIVDSSTSAEGINKSLARSGSEYSITVRQGEWIITMLAFQNRVCYSSDRVEAVLRESGVLKKGFQILLKEGEKWKILGLYHTIADKLHQ